MTARLPPDVPRWPSGRPIIPHANDRSEFAIGYRRGAWFGAGVAFLVLWVIFW